MVEKQEMIAQPSQVLDNTQIDEEIQAIVKSFDIVLQWFLSSKYYLRRDHIYPRGNKYRLMTLLFTSFLNALCVYQMYRDIKITTAFNEFISILNSFYDFIQMFIFTLLFILDFAHKQNHILLILKIQSINRSFELSKSIRTFIIWNWIDLLATICMYLYMHGTYYANHAGYSFSVLFPDCICDVMLIAFNVNYIFATRILTLLKIYLDEWVKFILGLSDREQNTEYCLKLIKIYQNILQAYNLTKSIFQNLIFSHVLVSFFQSLVFFYVSINVLKSEITLFHGMHLFVWVSKATLISLVHCVNCERFYISVEEAESACLQLMKNINCPKSHKHLCKTVIRLNRSFSKMSACGLVYIDARLAICFIGVVTNYAIVMLQFTFL